MKSEDVGLIVRAISFQDFQLTRYVILIHQRRYVTDRRADRRTDRRHAISLGLPRFSASHGKKTFKTWILHFWGFENFLNWKT